LNNKKIHFIGVCGTAMGSVAAAMKAKGFVVSGSDEHIYPPMSTFLVEQGVEILKGYKADHVPKDASIVVIGNAISRGNEEAEITLENRCLYQSLPEVLKEHFLRGKTNIVVSGTHGKTTTTSMVTWLLEQAGKNPSFMIGGIPKNMKMGARFTDSDFVVLEGDEYDTAFFDKRSKFLHYLPEVVIVNNIEFDHADIYDNIDQIKLTFSRLLRVVPRNGMTFINADDKNCREVAAQSPSPITFVGFAKDAQVQIENARYTREGSYFSLQGYEYFVPMPGEFNVRNAAMAICAAKFVGLEEEEIKAGLESFSGIARRQELRGDINGVKVIDDFAHHPTAIELAIQALRQQYQPKRLWVIFEPRSNTTRRSIFQSELAEALSKADIAVVSGVPDPQKVEASERLDPAKLIDDIRKKGRQGYFVQEVDEIVKLFEHQCLTGDVVAVLSNGGFDGIHTKLLKMLEAKQDVKAR
jgi:UDP-N-acetylmuramate: L-alanyl-gamma-D-glutamyl-meso-diaminopimelate ligase